MNASIRIDLHCHSTLSDGKLSPERLAARLAGAKVSVAALADHDTVQGQALFRRELARRGIGCVTAVEITSFLDGKEIHILAYDVDPTNETLLATLLSIRQHRQRNFQSLSDTLNGRREATSSLAPDGILAAADAIRLIHLAGGKAILAHPFEVTADIEQLKAVVQNLVAAGLDGLEALYARYDSDRQEQLLLLCLQHKLLVTAGSDFHENTDLPPGVEMPRELWVVFRDRLAHRGATAVAAEMPHRHSWRSFIFHIIFPTVLAIGLFVAILWLLVLPTLEQALMERKREMIRELTNSAWSVLAEARSQEESGLLTRAQAQELAKARIGSLRYGAEGKDYFWLQDMQPRMLMHPYRPDLNGKDVSAFQDPRGNHIFSEFADLVRRKNEGYIEYVWQWKDDPRRLVPKESYIRGFEPWGWIIGTGIYIEDVKEEIGRIEQNLVRISAAISIAVALLLLYVMRESMQLERNRCQAEDNLRQSTERYRSLVEAATEGTLLVIDNRCRYANPILLEMLGYSEPEMQLLELPDLLEASGEGNAAVWQAVEQLRSGKSPAAPCRGQLCRRDKSPLRCLITLRRMEFARQNGFILLARAEGGQALQKPPADHFLQAPANVAAELAAEISHATGPEQVIICSKRTTGMVRALLECGANTHHITRMTSAICDAATRQLVRLAIEQLGPPPAHYAVMALGSQGRQEQTLLTDQDNAIIYAPPDGRDRADIAGYFLEMGTRVCTALDQAGYAFCYGGIMANNARWCQPLSAWKHNFNDWIRNAQPQELLKFTIFFDFRNVCGQDELVDDLRRHIHQSLDQSPEFFPHFARNSLQLKAPIGLFGRIITGGAAGAHPGMLDLKNAMMPIVNFARLYALKHQLFPTGTMDRLAGLKEKGILLESGYQDIVTAYEALMRLRLQHQGRCIAAGKTPDNLIAPQDLGHIERAILKESFTEIDAVQKRISYDFLGGT